MAPQIFLDYGVVNGNDATTGAGGIVSLPPTQRLTFGLRYSFSQLFQGVSDRQRAAAECNRYRAAAGLARFVVENREQLSPAALDAKIQVLKQALPKAEEIVRGLRSAVEHQHATADELEATQLRFDDFQSEIVTAEALKAGLPPRAQLETPDALHQAASRRRRRGREARGAAAPGAKRGTCRSAAATIDSSGCATRCRCSA